MKQQKLFSLICSKEQFTEGSDKSRCQHSAEGGNTEPEPIEERTRQPRLRSTPAVMDPELEPA